MTAQELIAILQECPPDMLVLVDGYEEGLDNILRIREVQVLRDDNRALWSGLYFEPEGDGAAPSLTVLWLGGDREREWKPERLAPPNKWEEE